MLMHIYLYIARWWQVSLYGQVDMAEYGDYHEGDYNVWLKTLGFPSSALGE